VPRDFSELETATAGTTRRRCQSGGLRTEKVQTEVFLTPAATHVDKEGSVTEAPR
jgi:formate dehydrogenase major subunit